MAAAAAAAAMAVAAVLAAAVAAVLWQQQSLCYWTTGRLTQYSAGQTRLGLLHLQCMQSNDIRSVCNMSVQTSSIPLHCLGQACLWSHWMHDGVLSVLLLYAVRWCDGVAVFGLVQATLCTLLTA
jgi:hypothetical protein